MSIVESLRIALRSLRANVLRSVLTTLGIVIGVSSVIVLVALGNGISSGFSSTFGALANQLSVTPLTETSSGSAARDLTEDDAEALLDPVNAPAVVSVTPTVNRPALVQRPGGKQFQGSVVGSTTDYLAVNNRELVVGRTFDAAEERSRAKVVVLGPNVVAELFDGDAGGALGQEVRIGSSTFRIIGVAESDGQSDDLALMPVGAARTAVVGGGDDVSALTVVVRSSEEVPAALDQVTAILDQRHRIDDPADRDFTVSAFQSLLNEANQFLTYIQLFAVAVAAISLVVGGIGVANIMLVSVTERTREIGIRKAIGARRRAILQQFLLESTMLAAFGGLIGIALGVGISVTAAIVLPLVVPDFPVPVVSPSSAVLSFGVSLLIGVIAGGYPANRAARLRPIEALRYQ